MTIDAGNFFQKKGYFIGTLKNHNLQTLFGNSPSNAFIFIYSEYDPQSCHNVTRTQSYSVSYTVGTSTYSTYTFTVDFSRVSNFAPDTVADSIAMNINNLISNDNCIGNSAFYESNVVTDPIQLCPTTETYTVPQYTYKSQDESTACIEDTTTTYEVVQYGQTDLSGVCF